MNCFNKKETICPDCKNCVPNPDTGAGCSWSMRFEPVEGWEAEPTIILGMELPSGGFEEIPSYRVDSCPLFVSDKDQYAKPLRGKLKKGIDPFSIQALRCNGQKVALN